MKIFLLSILLSLSTLVHAEDKASNIFHDRSYWKTSPSVKDVKAKIKQGNDPVAFNPFSFDAIAYAILENVPTKTIKYLLSIEGNEVNKLTHDGRNYLLWAGYKGNLELVQLLMDMGADINLVDEHGYGMLTFTAVGGTENIELYDFILDHGIAIDEKNRSGATALLLLAPKLKDDATLDYFQSKGLSVKDLDDEGNGILHYAAKRGNTSLIKKLIALDVDYKITNTKGENLVFSATKGARGHSNSLEVYQYFDSLGLDMNVVNTEGQNTLHHVAKRSKSKDVLDYFISKGANPDQVDKEGNTPFTNAANSKNLAMIQHLAAFANVNQKNIAGYSALIYAVKKIDPESFKFLIENGANTQVIDNEGNNLYYHLFDGYRTRYSDDFDLILSKLKETAISFKNASKTESPLHIAIAKNQKSLVTTALELGADIDNRNKEGLTALHLAAMKSQTKEILVLLLENGANKELRTQFDESAFDLAQENELLSANQTDLTFLK